MIHTELATLYVIAAQDNSLRHHFTTLLAVLAPEAALWSPQIRTFLAAILRSYPAAFDTLYTRLSGEERETLRLVHEGLHAADNPRQQLYQQLGIDLAAPMSGGLPAFIHAWKDWWAITATVKPLPEAFGAFAVAFPVIENAFCGQLPHDTDLFTAFLLETEKHRKHWEAVLLPYAARLDLIAQGTRQALRQWHTLQDQLLSFLTDNIEKDEP